VRAIAEAHAPVFWAAGTHPMSAADEPMATVDELVALAQHPKFVGIGETGLDYHYTADSAEVQQESLRIHIEAARRPACRSSSTPATPTRTWPAS
jgi:TatD DNase family protein